MSYLLGLNKSAPPSKPKTPKKPKSDKPSAPRFNSKQAIEDQQKYIEELEKRSMVQDAMIAEIKLAMATQQSQGQSMSHAEILEVLFHAEFKAPKHKKILEYMQKAKFTYETKNFDYRYTSFVTMLEMVLTLCEVRLK